MNELIERLKNEADELSEKYEKLGIFIDSKKFDTLDPYVRGQMVVQHQSMLNYKWSLLNRVDYMEEQLKEQVDE